MQQCVVGKEGVLLYCHEQAVMGVCSSSVTKFGDVKLHIGGASMVQLFWVGDYIVTLLVPRPLANKPRILDLQKALLALEKAASSKKQIN